MKELTEERTKLQYRKVEYKSHTQSLDSETSRLKLAIQKTVLDLESVRLTNASNSKKGTRSSFKQIKEVTEERTKLREEVIEVRRGTQSAHTSTEFEKQK